MPGIDQRSPNFQAQLQSNSRVDSTRATDQTISRTTAVASVAAKKILQTKTQEKESQNALNQQVAQELLTQKADQQKDHATAIKQKSAQADAFKKNDTSNNPINYSASISQFAADINERKQRSQETRRLADSLNESNLEQFPTSANNPQSQTAAKTSQQSALVAGAFKDSVVPNSTDEEEKEVYKLLDEISAFGDEKGKAFASFAKREMAKGRYSEIKDLIHGFHQTLKNDRLTASQMVNAGNERLLTVQTMVSSSNTEELEILNKAMVARPDVSASFKLDQMYLRTNSGRERIEPPAFHKPIQPNRVEQVIMFVSTLNYSSLSAPWDKVA
jgi:hypothetical protein